MKTKRLPKWQKKLTAKQREHLAQTCDTVTLAAFKRNRAYQLASGTVCHECRSIALALRLEV